MSRRYTRRGTALLLVLALLVSMLGAALPAMQKSGAASGTFATAYTALLEKAPVAQADLERDPYGLCRLVVTGYGGKDYGAVAAAVTDGLAILQYDTHHWLPARRRYSWRRTAPRRSRTACAN